jgi:DNA-binding MarR family transcriptional regulator
MPDREPIIKELPHYDVLLQESQQYPELNPSACLAWMHLLKTGDELLALNDQFLSSQGVRPGKFNLLMIAGHCDTPPSPGELAECTGVTRATVSGLLDGMERDGLVVRKADPTDRRQIRVHLSEEGKQQLDRIRPAYCHWFSNLVVSLTEAERQLLINLLEKIQLQLATVRSEDNQTSEAA